MRLTDQIIGLVDTARSQGRNYDEVVQLVHEHGVPVHEVEPVLDEYRAVVDSRGRRRDQVNPGDPAEHGVR
jgi:hypothetical protein